MSKTLFTFLLSELGKVRILCHNKNCRKIVELDLEEMANPSERFASKCRFCGAAFDPTVTDERRVSILFEFATKAVELRRLKELVDLEFVLPQD